MIDHLILSCIAIISFSYLIGSIPFGIVFGKLFKAGDIRKIGSGNIGATNALRTGNKLFALCVLLGDGLKGLVAIIITRMIFDDALPLHEILAGMSAIAGHIFPVWLRFKGGKGVATSLGVMAILHWPTALVVVIMYILIMRLSRYSSLGAILAVLNAPLYSMALGGKQYSLAFLIMAATICFTERQNIKRLLNDEENKISFKRLK